MVSFFLLCLWYFYYTEFYPFPEVTCNSLLYKIARVTALLNLQDASFVLDCETDTLKKAYMLLRPLV